MAVDRVQTWTDREPIGRPAVDLDLVEHAARLHYDFGLAHGAIGSLLGTPPPRVPELLELARELGIVRVEVHTDASPFAELERDLTAAFGLQAAIVVPALDDPDRRRTAVARATAAYLRRTTHDGARVTATDDDDEHDRAICAALARGAVSVLVTDTRTAGRLLARAVAGTRED